MGHRLGLTGSMDQDVCKGSFVNHRTRFQQWQFQLPSPLNLDLEGVSGIGSPDILERVTAFFCLDTDVLLEYLVFPSPEEGLVNYCRTTYHPKIKGTTPGTPTRP